MSHLEPLAVPADQDLVVARRVRESRDVVSLYLEPTSGDGLRPFRAGQHLPLRLGLAGRAVATYTISSDCRDAGSYRISVKREAGGLGGSAWLHDMAPEGTVIRAAAPRGSFVVEPADNPVILLTGGIGITPALSMLRDLLHEGRRKVWFIHACNNVEEHSFVEELRALTEGNPLVRCAVAYANGTPEDIACGACQHLGFVDREFLQRLLPLDAYHCYLCGPAPFMVAMRKLLTGMGLPDAAIRQEDFGGTAASPRPAAPVEGAPSAAEVRFALSGQVATWDGSESLLDFAEAQGLQPEFSCRNGVCGTCACALVSGEVEYVEDPLDPPPEGQVLICCARPRGPVELAL